MIIGNGLLAKSFLNLDSDEFLIFVSGVSNSLETDPAAFLREETLLRNSLLNYPDKKIVYFSTCSVYDVSKKTSLYVDHKVKMEKIIEDNASQYLIYRIGNVIGKGGNRNTLFNFLVENIKNHRHFNLYKNAKRPLIDVDDLPAYFQFDKHRTSNKIVDVSYPYQYSLSEIISELEIFYNKKANFTEIDEGDQYQMSFSVDIVDFFKSKDSKAYLEGMINRYG